MTDHPDKDPRSRFVWKKGDIQIITQEPTPEGGQTMKHTCPKCGSENTIPILFGYPTLSMFEAADHGLVKIGGCVIGDNDPDRFCKDCEHEWNEEPAQ